MSSLTQKERKRNKRKHKEESIGSQILDDSYNPMVEHKRKKKKRDKSSSKRRKEKVVTATKVKSKGAKTERKSNKFKDFTVQQRVKLLTNLCDLYNVHKPFLVENKIFKKNTPKKIRTFCNVNMVSAEVGDVMNLIALKFVSDISKDIAELYLCSPKKKKTIQTNNLNHVLENKCSIKVINK